MSVSVTWYGHSNFKVSCGDVTVFIDPFFTHNPSCPVTWNEAGKPDLVLVTHDHGDHTGDAVAICKSSGATCGCIVGTAERLIDAGMPQASIPAGIGFNIGGTIGSHGSEMRRKGRGVLRKDRECPPVHGDHGLGLEQTRGMGGLQPVHRKEAAHGQQRQIQRIQRTYQLHRGEEAGIARVIEGKAVRHGHDVPCGGPGFRSMERLRHGDPDALHFDGARHP